MWTIIWPPLIQIESDYTQNLKFGIEAEKWIWISPGCSKKYLVNLGNSNNFVRL